jgi:hypothetical protein
MPRAVRKPDPPAFFHVPDGSRFTIADETADLMREVGYTVEEQELLALHALAPQAKNGDWIGLESGIVCPRQNLKTATMIGLALHDTFVQGVSRVVWTAHEFKTAGEAFRDLRAIVEGTPYLDADVLRIRTANGKEGFELRNGSRLDIIARTGRSGRGMAGDRLYADEALFLEGRMMGALVPTMSARRNAHLVYGSSPGVQDSEILRGVRDRGRSGTDPHLGYIEWTSPRGPCADPECLHRVGAAGCRLDDEELWWASNPALGRRITLEFVRQERRALESAPEEFMRERLGWWEDPVGAGEGTLYPVEEWLDCEDAGSEPGPGAPLVFSVDLSWDRERAHIGVAAVRADGLTHVDRVAILQPAEVKGFLAERVRRFAPLAVAVQGSAAPVSSLVPELQDIGIPVHEINGSGVAKASGNLYDAIRQRRIRHVGRQDLFQAASTAVPRALGDGWAIDRKKSPTDVAGLVAVVEALWVLDQLVGSSSYDVASSVY